MLTGTFLLDIPGRAKLEPIAIVIISVIMAVASLHLVEETIEKIIHLAFGESEPPTMDWITLGISSITVGKSIYEPRHEMSNNVVCATSKV